jgi:hypothetical protein
MPHQTDGLARSDDKNPKEYCLENTFSKTEKSLWERKADNFTYIGNGKGFVENGP